MVLLIHVSYVKIGNNVGSISNVSIVSDVNNVWFLNKKEKKN